MNQRKKILFSSVLVMTGVAMGVGAVALFVLYQAAFEQQRARLVETVQSRARLIEAVARYDATHSATAPGGVEAATLSKVVRAHEQFRGFGETGEFTLARREGDQIVFLLRHRHSDLDHPLPVLFDSELAEPMRLALTGRSGTVIGLDYRGERVLAAYERIATVNWGVVGKIDLAEIRGVFVKAGAVAAAVGLAVIFAGALLFLRGTDPLIKRLASSEARTRAVLDTAADGILTFGEDGVVDSFNIAAERMFGYAPGAAIGQDIRALVPPPPDAEHSRCLDYLLDTGSTGSGREYAGKRQDGTVFPVEAAISEVNLSGRRLFTGIFRDITKRKQAEGALRLNEARLETLVQLNEMTAASFAEIGDFALEEAVKLTSSKVGFLGFLNDDESVMTLHAWSKDAMAECRITDRSPSYHVDEAGLWGEAVRQRRAIIVNDYQPDDATAQGYPDGHVRVSRFLGVPVFDGERIVAVVAVANKEDEYVEGDVRQLSLLIGGMWRLVQRQRAEKTLRESRQFLQTIIDEIPEALMVIDRDHNVVLSNRAVRDQVGGKDPVAEGLHCFECFHARETACEGADHPCPLDRVVTTKAPVAVTHTHLDADGNESLVEIVAAPILDAGGEVVSIIESCRDITARFLAEEEARQRQAELAHVVRLGTMGEMASSLAHELNQPLAAIVNYIQACLMRTSAGNEDLAEMRADMERAAAQAERAARIIARIRNLVRKGEPKRVRLDVNALLHEAVDLLRDEMRQREVSLGLERGAALPPVCGDPTEIEQVIINLLRNGIEAMGERPAHLRRLTVRSSCMPQHVEVAVQDTGAGLPDGADDSVFDPFFTTKPNGMGMGLSISRTIIEAHGGTLWATPNEQLGTTFRFTLPADPTCDRVEY